MATAVTADASTATSTSTSTASASAAKRDFSACAGKTILLDLDGTLVDTDKYHLIAHAQILKPHGIIVDEEYFNKNIHGRQNKAIFGKLFPDMEESKLLEMAELKESVYRELLAKEGLEALAGVHDMVDAVLAAGIRASCVTNAPRLNAEAVLTATKLRDKFEHLVIGDECERGKPFPDPYETGMKLMDAKPENTIVFEDSPSGIKAAVAAKARAVIGIETTQSAAKLTEAGATATITAYKDITPEALAGWFGCI